MKVEVTQRHIDNGNRCDCWDCPIAKALSETLSGHVAVGSRDVNLPGISGSDVPLPPEAIAFIKAYDAGQQVQPFSFELPL